MFRTDMEISINYQQKKLQKKIDKLNYLNNLSDELQIKYDNILTSFNNIIELNSNHTNFNTLKNISKINTLVNRLMKEIKERTEISETTDVEKKAEIKEIKEIKEITEVLELRTLKSNQKKTIIKWFCDSIIETKGTKIRRSIIYENYLNYCKANSLLARKRTEVFKYIYDVMGTVVKIKGYHYFNGYELKN